MSDKTKAVIYARYSPRPDDGDASIRAQVLHCRKYCREKGYKVVGVFTDEGRSGADPERPGLLDAINAVPVGGVLVAYRLDRIARDVYLSEVIRRQVQQRGARIETVLDASANGDAPEDQLIRQILQAFAEYERKVIAARTRLAMRRHQAAGKRMSRFPPYGWKIDPADPSRLVEDPAEQEAIKRILEWYHQGFSNRAIARMAEQQGLPKRQAEKWNHSLVNKIVKRYAKDV